MKIYLKFAVLFGFLLIGFAQAETREAYRKLVLSNDQVKGWYLIMYPHSIIKMHPHPYNYLIIPIDNGTLTLTTSTNEVTNLSLDKEKIYPMPRLPDQVMHQSENRTGHTIRMVLIELKKD